MSNDQLLLYVILTVTMLLFIFERWRYDIVALLALFVSVVVGVVPSEKAFTGFCDPAVITVATVLVMSAAISRSGAIDYVLSLLSHVEEKPRLQITVLVGIVMSLSAFMNNVGALAILLPIALSFAKRTQRKASELLMPISFGSLLGGLVTLIGTPPNLLISNVRQKILGEPYHMFDFAPVGLGVCAVGLLYLSFGWKLLPKDRQGAPSADERFTIEDYISEAEITEEDLEVATTINDLEELEDDITIAGIIRNKFQRLIPASRMRLRAGDIIIIESPPQSLEKFLNKSKARLLGSEETEELSLSSDEVGVIEAVLREDSQLIGYTAKELRLRSRFNVNLLAVRQAEKKISSRLNNVRFRSGDVVVLQGHADAMPETLRELGCFPLAERKLQLGSKHFVLLPTFILATAVGLTVAGLLPVHIAFLGGMLAIALLRIMRLNEIYESIDAPVLVLLGAMIPITNALQDIGGTEAIASGLVSISSGLSGHALLAAVLLFSMAVTPFLNNAAAVLLMAPVAISLAQKLEYNPDAFLMAVAIGTSCDFLTPIGHQSNTLVMGPGGYKFGDYWRLGLPLSILVAVVAVPLISSVWGLH